MMRFDGNKLKALRTRAGFESYRDFAKALRARGTSATGAAVMNWENGDVVPSSDYLFLIADILGISADDLKAVEESHP